MNTTPAHTITLRVYYADTDCGNVVYYANYLRYLEQARTEFLRDRGVDLGELQKREGIVFAVTETHVKYRASARYNDLLTVETRLLAISSVLLTFENAITNQDNLLLVKAETTLACVGDKGRAVRIPHQIAQKLSGPTTEAV